MAQHPETERLPYAPDSASHAALLAARTLLCDVTPLKTDCGRLCGAACCQPATADGQPSGMYLFPGEQSLYGPDQAWAQVMPTDWEIENRAVPLLVCEGTCPREERPLACRLFPLSARIDARQGSEGFFLKLDPRAWPVCPLMPHGLPALDPAFVAASRTALALLWACPEHRAFLRALDALLAQYESFA